MIERRFAFRITGVLGERYTQEAADNLIGRLAPLDFFGRPLGQVRITSAEVQPDGSVWVTADAVQGEEGPQ